MRKFLLVGSALFAFAAPAVAQDAAVFSGPRVEAHVGWDRTSIGSDGFSFGKSGVAYGFGIGYDVAASSSVVLGLEANIDWASTKSCVGTECIKVGRDIDVMARAGVPVASNMLFYGKVGYANGRLKLTDDGDILDAGNGDGVRLGIGLEAALAQNFYGKVEYRYTNYQDDFSRNQILAGVGIRF